MYSKKTLQFVFNLDDGNGQSENMTLQNIKSLVSVDSYGGMGGTQAEIALYGLSAARLSLLSSRGINALVTDGRTFSVKVYSGDIVVFDGNIRASYANMNAAPDNPLMMNAVTGLYLRNKTQKPFSQQGTVSVESILSTLCQQNGYTLKAVKLNGIMHQNPYLQGSAFEQIATLCHAHRLDFEIIGSEVYVWPVTGAVDDVMPHISPENGLIGYPVYSENGLTFQTQYSPLLSFGRIVSLQTSLPHASGRYRLWGVNHFLSSWVENGPWHSVCMATQEADE